MRFLIVVALVALSILAVNSAPLEERNGEESELTGPGSNAQLVGEAAYEALSRNRRTIRRRRPVSSSSSSSSSEEIRRHKGGRAQAMHHAQAARRSGHGKKLGGRQFYAAAPIAYTGYPSAGYPQYPAPMMAPMYG